MVWNQQDQITLTVQTDESGKAAIEANQELLQKTVGASELQFADTDGEEVFADTLKFTFSIN